MKILHVQRVSGMGGSERHLTGLLPGLARAGVDVEMCVLATGDAHLFVEALRAGGVAVTVLPAGPDVNPLAVARLGRVIRRSRPDLVHTHLIHGDTHGQVAARLLSVGSVSTFHAAPPFYLRQPFRAATRAVARLPWMTIAISAHLGRFLTQQGLVPPERVRVVHYGIDAKAWRMTEPDRAAARASWGLEPDDVAVGIASRLVPEKGHADLVEAVATARERVGMKLLVAGAGPLRPTLEAQATALLPAGTFRFLGFTADVRAFVNACDVFVFPTTPEFGEGFGMAALEASAAGRPVVGTDVGPIPEVVADGESGLIVPPRSPRDLAAALVRLAEDGDLRRRLGEGGTRRAETVFGFDRMVEHTIGVYEEARRYASRHDGRLPG
jgi:glycosyltransferase involved in cell wall biosynthesis